MKKESTAGTSSDPLDKTNAYTTPSLSSVRVRDLEVTVSPEVDDEDSKYLTGDFTGDESIVGKLPSSAKFNIKGAPAEWDSSGGVSANIHRLNYDEALESAGLNLIEIGDGVTADADYTYPKQYLFYPSTDASVNTMTLTEVSKDETGTGIATEVVGGIGNLVIGAEGVGKPISLGFEMMGSTASGDDGVWEISSTDMAKLGFDDANVMGTVATKFINTTIELIDVETQTSVLVCSAKLELNTGNTVSPIDCQQSKSGMKNNVITEQKPRFSITPQLKKLSEFEYWKALTMQSKYTIDVKTDYQNANGIFPFRLFVPSAQLLSVPRGDEGGIVNQELTFRPLRNTEKLLPDVKYVDQADGLSKDWDHTGTTLDGKEAEAMWLMIIGEEEVV